MRSSRKSYHGFAVTSIVLLVAGVITAGAVGYVGYQVLQEDNSSKSIATTSDFHTESNNPSTSTARKNTSSTFDSWKSYQSVSHWFSFYYPHNWILSTGESEGKDEVVVRVKKPEYSGVEDTDTPVEQFLIRNKNSQDCQFGELTEIEGLRAFDTGWVNSGFTGLPQRDICFDTDEIGSSERNTEIKISLSARDESSINTMNRILSSFDFRAIPHIPITRKDISARYEENLLSSSEFEKGFLDGVEVMNINVREPVEFTLWDRVGTEDDPLAVLNLLYEVGNTVPTGYEIILFDIDTNYSISNPSRIDFNYTAGGYSQNLDEYMLQGYETIGNMSVNLRARIPELVEGGDIKYIQKEFAYTADGVSAIED